MLFMYFARLVSVNCIILGGARLRWEGGGRPGEAKQGRYGEASNRRSNWGGKYSRVNK